jgi:hypothetical protein
LTGHPHLFKETSDRFYPTPMRRPYSFFSPFSLGLTLIMILFLSLSVWFRGGMAFSPGRLSANSRAGTTLEGFNSHAEFEAQCQRCHQPAEASQNILCVDCHQAVAEQLVGQSGVHGVIAPASQCAACHPDHRGRDFDPASASHSLFDHTKTDYSLSHHHFNYDLSPMACAACHLTQSASFAPDVQRCNTCHTKQAGAFMLQHNQEFGTGCLTCHNGEDGLAKFDHATTSFPLVGKHSQVSCIECHPNANPANAIARRDITPISLFSGVSKSCVDCHPQPSSHVGVFDANCEQCHHPAGWQPANLEGKLFDHELNTTFSLVHHLRDYQGQPLACSDCHPGGFSSVDGASCTACHAVQDAGFMQQHTTQFGPACMECHDGRDRMRNFDHQAVFPLEGSHAQIACLDCHKGGVFHTAMPRCADCHSEPAIHLGFFGLECQECHASTAWSPAFLKVHTFPLDHGGGGQVACQTCHSSAYVEFTCYGCHDDQPDQITREHAEHGISSIDLPNCTQCHPTGLKEGEG